MPHALSVTSKFRLVLKRIIRSQSKNALFRDGCSSRIAIILKIKRVLMYYSLKGSIRNKKV